MTAHAAATADIARAALAAADAAAPGRVWIVGGAIRDVLLGDLEPLDLDLAVDGDPAGVAKAVAEALNAPRFPLSDRFGGYRVTAAGGIQVDVMPLHPDGLDADLLRRDLTVNALALPLAAAHAWPQLDPADVVDRVHGIADLRSRVLRVCGPSSLTDDPLRVLRIARAVAGAPWTVDGETVRRAQHAAPGLHGVAGERIGAEIRAIVCGTRPLLGLELLSTLGGTAAVLPELEALEGVEQSGYHHLDVAGHTREVLGYTLALEHSLDQFVDPDVAAATHAIHGREIAGGWTGAEVLRLGALLHDIAKPRTRVWFEERRMIGFPNHDRVGREMTGEILDRLRYPRKVIRMAQALTLHHLRLGFLVHAQPLDEAAVYGYLHTCEPVEVEVTVLGLADRLATRGRRAEPAIEAHADLTRLMLPRAVAWREAGGAPTPLHDGDALTSQLERPPGPWLADALEAQRRARFIDPALTPDAALDAARAAADAR
ncbi:MAG: HD domain-containing protein [Solirubrobacteraceae bacterium]|nr:HD domain-containing protein [Patulibacter sp.]